MKSLNGHEIAGTARCMENDSLFMFPLEAILERHRPMKLPVPRTFADVEKVVVVFTFIVVEVVLVSRPGYSRTVWLSSCANENRQRGFR